MTIPAATLGVLADADAESVPPEALVAAENWIFEDGELRVRPGFAGYANDVNQRPMRYVQYVHNDAAARIVMGTTTGWWELDGTTWTNITDGLNPLTGGNGDHQIFRIFQKSGATWLLGVNGANTMKKWDGVAASYSAVGGTPPRAKAMMVLGDRVILGHLLTGGTISGLAVDVSALQDFDSGWGTVLTAIIAAETPGNIVVMQEMGNLSGAIYKEDAIAMAIAQSSSDPFRFETKVTQVDGPPSPHCVVPVNDGLHLVLSRIGAIMRFDGVSYVSLGRKFQAHITETANIKRLNLAFGLYDADRNFAWFFYPETASLEPAIGIAINLNNMSLWPLRLPWSISSAGRFNTNPGLTIGDLDMPIGAITQTLGQLASVNDIATILVGEVGGQTYRQSYNATTDGGTAIPFNLRTGRYGLGEGTRFKTVTKVEHRFKKAGGAQNVSVQLGISDYGDDELLSTAQVLNVGADGPYLSGHRKSGKFISMRMSGSASQRIVYNGSAAHVTLRGGR